jgi:hypothetical protein
VLGSVSHNDYAMVNCLQMYSRMLKRQGRLQESEEALEEAYRVADTLARWANRI